jgi:DUF917 family protein
MTRQITLDDIESLAVGAWILGTGGGGSPYLGLLNMRRLYAEGHPVTLMSPLDLADDDRVAVVSNMGAPLVGQERLARPTTEASDPRPCPLPGTLTFFGTVLMVAGLLKSILFK